MKVFLENMLSAAISSSVTILLILLARGVLHRRLRPAAYTLLWGALLLRLLLPVRLELPAQGGGEMIAELQRIPSAVVSSPASQEQMESAAEDAAQPAQARKNEPGRVVSGYEIAGICYFSVAGILIAGLIANNVRWSKRLDSAPEGDVDDLLNGCCAAMGIVKPKVVIVDRRTGIGVAGIFKKRLLLDESYFSLSRQRKRAVLMHEAAHIRGRHMELLLLSRLLCAVYWFDPLVWAAMSLFRQDMETAADYTALQRLSVSDTEYAESLLQTARAGGGRKASFLLAAAADKRRLEKRIRTILNFGSAKKTVTAVCLLLAAVSVAAGCAAGAYPAENAGRAEPAAQERRLVTYSAAKENISPALLETATQELGVTYDEIVDIAQADLDGDGTEENFIYYARGSQGTYTESGFGLAAIGADETTVLEEVPLERLYGYPIGQVLLLADESGVRAAVLCAEHGGSADEKIYGALLRENGEWRDIFGEYGGGYPYTVTMLDGPKAEVRWKEPSGREETAVLDARTNMEGGYSLGYFALDGTLTARGREYAGQIDTCGFDRMEAGLSGNDLTLRAYQKIAGFHKLDMLGEFVTEWRYHDGVWEVAGKTAANAADGGGDGTMAFHGISALFADPHDPEEQDERADLDGDGEQERIVLTDLRYNGGDGGYALAVFRENGEAIPLPETYREETGFPYSVRWTGSALEICADGTAVARLTEEQAAELCGKEAYAEAALGTEPWELPGDAVSGFVLREQEDGRTAVFVKTYLWGAGAHSCCLGYGVTEMLLGRDGGWDVNYWFMLDE